MKQSWITALIALLFNASMAFSPVCAQSTGACPFPTIWPTLCQLQGEFVPQFQITQPTSTNTWLGQGWTNNRIFINATVTVNNSFSFTNCDLNFGPLGRILVVTNGHLTSTNTDYFSCGSVTGWPGIRVDGGGMLSFTDGNRVQDAQIAIDIASSSPIIITGNTFDRNDVGINAFLVQANAFIVGNTFDCTSNTYTGQRSAAGVRTKKAVITLGTAAANDVNMKNIFRNQVRAIDILPASTVSIYYVDISCSSEVGLYAEGSNVFFNAIPFNPANPPSYKNLFTNNRADILTKRTNLNLAYSDFTECQTDNIKSIENTNAETIFIEYNYIRINNDNSLTNSKNGIYLERSSGGIGLGTKNQIKGNIIYMDAYDTGNRRSGVVAKGFPGTFDQMFIQENLIFPGPGGSNPNQSQALTSTFLEVEINSASNFNLYANKIYPSNINANFNRNRWGIYAHTWQAPSSQNTMWMNEVLGDASYDYGCCAFHFSNSGPWFICANHSNNTLRGFHFRGDCECSTFSINTIGEHSSSNSPATGLTAGIKLDMNVAYGSAQIGLQPCMGNSFLVGNYTPDWGAWNESDLLINKFTYNPTQAIQIPNPINPNQGWFFPDLDCPLVSQATHCPIPYSNCGGEYRGVVQGAELETVNANQILVPPADVFEWQSRLDILGKLLRYPELKNTYPETEPFFNLHINTSAGLFAQFNELLDQAMVVPEVQSAELYANQSQTQLLLNQLNVIDLDINDLSDIGQITASHFIARQNILQQISTLQNNLESILESIALSRSAVLYSCAQFQNSLPSVNVYETNQKFLNGLAIKKAQGIEFTASEYTMLQNIAQQCPEIAGNTRYRAINRLPKNDPLANENEDPIFPDCQGLQQGEDRKELAKFNPHDVQTIVPNPADAIITVVFGYEFSGDITINDVLGQQHLIKRGLLKQEQLTLPLEGIAPGVYFLTSISQTGFHSTTTFVVGK